MIAADLKIGDVLIYKIEDKEYEYQITKIKNQILYYKSIKVGTDHFCSFNDMNDLLKAGTMTIKINLMLKKKNNNGSDVCIFCGGKTRKCGGMNPKIDYRVCIVCGK